MKSRFKGIQKVKLLFPNAENNYCNFTSYYIGTHPFAGIGG